MSPVFLHRNYKQQPPLLFSQENKELQFFKSKCLLLFRLSNTSCSSLRLQWEIFPKFSLNVCSYPCMHPSEVAYPLFRFSSFFIAVLFPLPLSVWYDTIQYKWSEVWLFLLCVFNFVQVWGTSWVQILLKVVYANVWMQSNFKVKTWFKILEIRKPTLFSAKVTTFN